MTELLVTMDDSIGPRQMVGFTLTQAGYQVPETMEEAGGLSDGAKAEKEMGEGRKMPGMDGIALVGCGDRWQGLNFIPVSMLIDASRVRPVQSGQKASVTGWIGGTFKAGQLVAVAGKACL